MEKICTLCKFSTQSEFSWESHLARNEHQFNKLRFDNANLLDALESLSNRYLGDNPVAGDEEEFQLIQKVRAALAAAKGE